MTINFYRSPLVQIIRKWLVLIFTIAFWGTESKLLSYENKPYTVWKYEMLPKYEVMMLLEQEDGCAINLLQHKGMAPVNCEQKVYLQQELDVLSILVAP